MHACACIACNGMEWNGMEWNGMEWNGMEWNGMEWNGMEWNGMEWNGMEWIGMEWNGNALSYNCNCMRTTLVLAPSCAIVRPYGPKEQAHIIAEATASTSESPQSTHEKVHLQPRHSDCETFSIKYATCAMQHYYFVSTVIKSVSTKIAAAAMPHLHAPR